MYNSKFSKTLLNPNVTLFCRVGVGVGQGFMYSQTGFERGWSWPLDPPFSKCQMLSLQTCAIAHVCAELGSGLACRVHQAGTLPIWTVLSRLKRVALWFLLLRGVGSVAVLEAFSSFLRISMSLLWCGGCVVLFRVREIIHSFGSCS